jgi:hypothetical protein
MAGIAFAAAGVLFMDLKGERTVVTIAIVTQSAGFRRLGDRRHNARRTGIASLMAVVAPLPLPGRMNSVHCRPGAISAPSAAAPVACLMTEPAFGRTGAVDKLPSIVIQFRHRLPVILQDRIGMAEAAVKLLLGVPAMQPFSDIPE